MKIKHIVMRVMVWNMKWMTRYLTPIARSFIKIVAVSEIIACGLRDQNGQVNIIYSPTKHRKEHFFYKNKEKVETKNVLDFSQGLVTQNLIPNAKNNEIYRVKAKNSLGVTVKSPKIKVKPESVLVSEMVKINRLDNGQLKISWDKGKSFDPMIYFMVIEDPNNKAICGIYTRDNKFIYPRVKKASLNIGNQNPSPLEKGQKYTIKLVVVDYDGWVPALSGLKFIY